MPRYYVLTETVEAIKHQYNQWRRVYDSDVGYLFHDTENALTVHDIRKPLWRLSKLYEDSKQVVCVQVDENTIMGSFSTRAVPRPGWMSVNWNRQPTDDSKEYLQTRQLKGWVIDDIHDPTSAAHCVDYNELFAECLMLERAMGRCPCPRLAEGTCFPETVYKKLPQLAEARSYNGTVVSAKHKTKDFANIDGFEYVSGQHTTEADFSEALRPWNNHDFNIVELRKKQFKDRGQEHSRRLAHRKEACANCAFAIKQYDGGIKDCGQIRSCTQPSTEEDIRNVLYAWLEQSPYKQGNNEFSRAEIEYLVTQSGLEYPSRALSPTRTIETMFGGFHYNPGGGTYSPELVYQIVPVRGQLNRVNKIISYEGLRQYFPHLPQSHDLQTGVVPDALMLAYAILSTWRSIKAFGGHQPHDRYALKVNSHSATLHGCTTRSSFEAVTLSIATPMHELYTTLWPHSQDQVHVHANQLKYNTTIRARNQDTPQ